MAESLTEGKKRSTGIARTEKKLGEKKKVVWHGICQQARLTSGFRRILGDRVFTKMDRLDHQ